ncbi:MAG: tetratricopeptide repeat protein [Bacteroidota bacterium]
MGEFFLLFLGVLFLGGCTNLRQTLDSSGKRSSEISKEQQNQATIRVIDGALYDVKEDRARAILEYEEALQYDSAAGIYLAISKDYSLLGKHTLAIRHAREALRLDPENTDYRQNLADIYLAARDLESALKEYEAIVQRDSTSIRVLYTIGRIHQQQQQYAKALEIYKTIRDRFGPSWQTLFQMATVYEWLKQLDSAATMYQEMLVLDPNNSELKKRLAGTYLRANKPDTALVFLNELHRQDSSDVEINVTRGSVYIQKKEWETAFSIFLPIVMRDSITVEAALGLGVEFLRAGPDTSGALHYARILGEHIRDRFPRQWQSYVFLGDVEVTSRHDSLAAEYYEKAISLNDRIVDPYIQLGLLYFQQNKLDPAISVLERGRILFPDEFRILFYLGLGYTQSGKNYQALPLLERAVRMDSKNVDALGALAQNLDALKRFTESDSIYDRALSLDPKNHLLLNNYSYSLAERETRLDDALKMSAIAVEKDSTNSAYMDTLGWIFFKMKQYANALRLIQRAVDLRQQTGGNDAVLLEHLGDVFQALGEKEKAVEAWEKALETNQTNQGLRDKIQRYQQ